MQHFKSLLTTGVFTFLVGVALTFALLPLLAKRKTQTDAGMRDSNDAPNITTAETQTSSIAKTIMRLREIKGDAIESSLPETAPPLLALLKRQLRALLTHTIQTQGELDTPQTLRARVLDELKREGVRVGQSPDIVGAAETFETEYTYGDIYDIQIEQPINHPELLVATTTLGICCGEDTSFYLFQRKDGKRELSIAEESNGYADVSGAQGRFSYAMSPSDRTGDFFVFTANVNPWCTSWWQSLRYRVLRRGGDADSPDVILSAHEIIYLGVDEPYHLKIGRNIVTINFEGESNPDEINRRHEVSYRIEGERAMKIAER